MPVLDVEGLVYYLLLTFTYSLLLVAPIGMQARHCPSDCNVDGSGGSLALFQAGRTRKQVLWRHSTEPLD